MVFSLLMFKQTEKMGKDTQVQEGDLQGKMLQLLKHPELCPIFFAFLEKSFRCTAVHSM